MTFRRLGHNNNGCLYERQMPQMLLNALLVVSVPNGTLGVVDPSSLCGIAAAEAVWAATASCFSEEMLRLRSCKSVMIQGGTVWWNVWRRNTPKLFNWLCLILRASLIIHSPHESHSLVTHKLLQLKVLTYKLTFFLSPTTIISSLCGRLLTTYSSIIPALCRSLHISCTQYSRTLLQS